MLVPVRLTVLPSPLDSVPHRVRVFSELPEVTEEVNPPVTEVVSAALAAPTIPSYSVPLTSTVLEEVLLLEVEATTLAIPHPLFLSLIPI